MATKADFEKEFLDKANAGTYATHQQMLKDDEKTKADKQASTQKYITGQGEIIDRATANSVKKVQQQIDAAPEVYQGDFDRNAIAEMVNRKKLEESMANMGLTDSGLNRTQQTALSVQKGNADAATRKSMREYVNKLEEAITDITVAGESQKQQTALDANKSMDDWFTQLDAQTRSYLTSGLDANRQNSYTYGADMWNAQQQAAATVEAANIAAQAERDKAASAAADANFNKVVQLMDKGGMTYEEATAAIFGTPTTPEYVLSKEGEALLTGFSDESANISGWSTMFSTPSGDGEEVYEQVLRDVYLGKDEFKKLSEADRDIVAARLIGKTVAKTWEPDEDNGVRIRSAVKQYLTRALGYEEEGIENNEDYKNLVKTAIAEYNETYVYF